METTTLGQLATDGRLVFSDGYRTKQSELGEPGISILRVAEVHDGRIVPTHEDHVRDEYRPYIGLKKSMAGDVIVTTKGSVGRVAQVREGMPEFVYSPQLCFFRATRNSDLDQGFLYQWFRGREFRNQLFGVQSQTDMAPYVNLADLRNITISVPTLVDQRAIASVLGGLDDKVESNDRVIALTRDVARIGMWQAAREGVLLRVGDVAEVRKGLSYKGSGLAQAGLPMVNMGNAASEGWLKRDGFKYYSGEFKSKHLATGGSLLVVNTEQTWRQEIIGWPMILPMDIAEALFTHHVFLIEMSPEWSWARWALWAHLYTSAARGFIDGRVYGTTVATLPASAIADLMFPVPPAHSHVHRVAESLLRRAWAAEVETQTLATMRDALLPGLLSGRQREARKPARVESLG